MTTKFAFMNGWVEAPHCWKYHLFLKPFRYETNPAWSSVSIFGFVVFWYESAKP